MKIMDWNIEWMNNWFVGSGAVEWKPSLSGVDDLGALVGRVANVIKSVDPDVLTIQEGPSDIREMQLFIDDYLSDASGSALYQPFGGFDGRTQKVYILVKNGGEFQNARLADDPATVELLDYWLADIDGDGRLESYEFTRGPLVLDGEIGSASDTVRIVTLHTKSKFVNRGQEMWESESRRQEFVEAALKNRRRISTEAMHTRDFLNTLHEVDTHPHVVVTGDFNDGPGVDYFEKYYLTHSVADILLGSVYRPDRQYTHALIGNVPQDELFTARFDDFVDEIDDRPLLLDHVLVSPALHGRFSNARVAHTEFNAGIDTTKSEGSRDRLPSDHRPIVVDIA